MLIGALLLIAIFLFYKILTSNFDHFEKLGIPYVKPFIFLGSFYKSSMKKEPLREELIKSYQKYKSYKAFGVFQGSKPLLVINDLELLKKITVKDFDNFRNHARFIDAEDDPLSGNTVFALEDDRWHDMRTTLSPAFTGSKMRLMHQLITNLSEKAVKYLENNYENTKNGFDIDMKDFFTLFASDAIASVAFGLDVKSLEDKNSEFYKMSMKFITLDAWTIFKMMTYSSLKKVYRVLGIKVISKEFNRYWYRLVIEAFKYRKENNVIRQDMINMLIEAQSNPNKSHNHEWNDEELVAQCYIFLFAGLESVSTTLCFATQELIENLDIQEKLIKEIDLINEELNGQSITYDTIIKMKYMDMFVSEVLRKWPPFIQTDRKVTKTYRIDEENLKITLKPGDMIWLPIVGLHMDEKYFPNPEKFDPERFSDENKENIKQLSYMPFGYGPRICIASRLAILEIKTILFYVLSNYKLDVSAKSTVPAVLAPTNFPITMKNGFWLKMKPRR